MRVRPHDGEAQILSGAIFQLAASRIETAAVLEKVDGLATDAAKRRHLEKAIATLRSDNIPDELQADQLRELEERLWDLG